MKQLVKLIVDSLIRWQQLFGQVSCLIDLVSILRIEVRKMADETKATLAQLDAEIAAQGDQFVSLAASIAKINTDLDASISAQARGLDVSTELAAIRAHSGLLGDALAALSAVDTKLEPPDASPAPDETV